MATGRDRLQHRQWTHKDKSCERPVSVDRGSIPINLQVKRSLAWTRTSQSLLAKAS